MNIGEIISLSEPQLQFSTGRHNLAIDPRFGLKSFHPLDYNTGRRDFSIIDIGVIAKEDDVGEVLSLLSDLNKNFKPRTRGSGVEYIGFGNIYKVPINIPEIGDRKVITISNTDINKALRGEDAFYNIKNLYNSKIQQYVDENRERGVLIIQISEDFEKYFKFNYEDLRTHIKALCIKKHVFAQILTQNSLQAFDSCDNMWNLSLGLYVKAGGVPWKLKIGEEGTCFIGIAFGIKKSADGQDILVGLAEVFDLFGESVTIKVVEDSFDTEVGYYLSTEKAEKLIRTAIESYINEKRENPRKVIIHKTTFFNLNEQTGIENALGDISYDLVHIKLNTSLRLVPDDKYPPQRGTFWKIDDKRGILYTVGKIEEFGTYPGPGTPSAIEISRDEGSTDTERLAKQILDLAKMDWNTTVLMSKEPITIKFARKVSDVLKAGVEPEEILKDFRYYIYSYSRD